MRNPVFLVGAFAVALVFTLMGFMAPASVLGAIIKDWDLSNAEAGWVGGALFAGYIATVPVLTAWTDRIDPKRIYLCSAAIGALGNLGVAFIADGLWSGVVFRVLTGIGLAGTFMPGLKALTDQLPEGKAQQRGATYYSSFFALGSGLSILIAGVTADFLDWRWAFIFAGCGGIAALLIVSIVLPAKQAKPADIQDAPPALNFGPIFRDRAIMAYVVASLGVAWEVFTSRVWLVTFFFFVQDLVPDKDIGWSPAIWSTVVALVGVPAAMVIGELSVRYDRARILSTVAAFSAGLCVAIGFSNDLAYEYVLLICIVFGMTSYGRSASTTAGTIAVAPPERRGAALAVQAFVGFSGGILGPLAFGIALDVVGGNTAQNAWVVAMCVMAVGPVLTILALLNSGKSRPSD